MKKQIRLSIIVLFLLIIIAISNSEPLFCMEDPNEAVKEILKNENNSSSISVNLTDAFKYVGGGAAAASIGTGVAKVIKTFPPQSRAATTIITTGIIATAGVATSAIKTISTSPSKNNSNITLSKDIKPDITADANISIGEHTKIKIESLNVPSTPSNSIDTSNSSDPSQIPSIFEDNFISNIIQNDPYLVLIYCILFLSLIGLYTLIALNIAYVIKNNRNLDNKISKINNSILTKIYYFYKKYNAALFGFWFLALYIIILMIIIISIVLIDQYPSINSLSS